MVDSILTVVLEVVKCLAPPIERQIRYLRNYNNNIENLNKEIEEMKGDRTSLQHKVDEAKRQGEDIEERVDKWLESVNKVMVEAEELAGIHEATTNKRCFKGLCPNLKARLQFSKDAVRQVEAISKLRETGRLFDRISYRSIPEDIQLLSRGDYEAFESRMSTLNEILGALKDPDVYMLGIYGMGGIGKTMLAKKVATQVKNDFDQVVFAEVSLSQDIRKIQGEIADKLCLKFHEETESGRARSLCNRLRNEKRILVILDNIWENLDLHAVGIPHGDDHKGCKVLLTARSKDVLLGKMDSQLNFQIGVLEEKEAWSLFRKMAGDYIEGSQFKLIATEVAKECAGLPVSIVMVGRALRNKGLFEWKDALEQLRRPSSTNFQNIQSSAYSAIELSYNKLEGEELKKIFLLIAYAGFYFVDDLLMYGMGLDLFEDINHMEEARARAHTLVHKLKASCMLLDDRNNAEGWFSIHDVVRDVAIAIASRELNVLTMTDVELVNRWELLFESTTKFYYSIVLEDVKTNMLPEELECPQLKLFAINAKRVSSLRIPENFFAKMKQVRVLDLTCMHLLPLPSSFGLLTNLRTLCLYECKLQDTSVIGNFKKLEILCLQGSEMKQLSEEIGQLTCLKLLKLRDCERLEIIPPNVLSKLSRLEELYIGGFSNWGLEVEGQKNASLDELKHLRNLTSLQLRIKDVNTLPRGLFFEKLEWFDIRMGNYEGWWDMDIKNKISRTFKLELNTSMCWKYGMIVQLKKVEDLCLSGLREQDVKYFIRESVEVGSLPLKRLYIKGCDAPNFMESERGEKLTDIASKEIISDDVSFFTEKVVLPNLESITLHSINIERIWQSQLAAMSCGVQNLRSLEVYECRNLKCLFPYSILCSCVRLQNLKIEKCPIIEEIIVVDQIEMNDVIFPRLQFLKMIDLKKLKSFSTGDVHVEFPVLKQVWISECPEFMVQYKSFNHELTKKASAFSNLENLGVDEKYIPWIFQFPEDSIPKLKCIDVFFEDESTIMPTLDLLQKFHPIKFLEITGAGYEFGYDANEMKVVIRKANGFGDLKLISKPTATLDNLERLIIVQMKCGNLMEVPFSNTFQNLKVLEVWSCEGLKKLLTSTTAKSLVRLREMTIVNCSSITEIVTFAEGDDDATKDEIIFYELKLFKLIYLPSLTSFCSSNCAFKFPSLETLVVDDCPNMKTFSQGELCTPKLHKVQLDRWKEESWVWEHDLNTTIRQLYLKTEEGNSSEEDIGQPSMQLLE